MPTFRLDAPVVIRAKVEEVRNNVAIYSHTLLRIHVIGGQRSVRIAPPSLPPHHSGPATRDFQSSISVEVLFHRCHLDVQGLLYQQLQMTPVEERFNRDGGLEVPGCWTAVMRRQGGRSNPHRPLTSNDVYPQ